MLCEVNPQCSTTAVTQRTVAKKSARNDANQLESQKVNRRSWRSEAKPVLPRRAAQAEIKIAYDQCGPRNTWRTFMRHEVITFTLAMRSTSRESSNHTLAARDLAVRWHNKHYVTPWSREAREAVFRNLGVVQDLLRKWCHQFRTAAWPRRIMTTSLSQHHSNEARLS